MPRSRARSTIARPLHYLAILVLQHGVHGVPKLLFSPITIIALVDARHYKFALCPKFINNGYFDIARDGCADRAAQLSNDDDTFECLYVGTEVPGEFGDLQAEAIMAAMDDNPDLDGLSISVTQAEDLQIVYQRAAERGIPFVTFDSDDVNSDRLAYIGTDNFFMGTQLSKVLQKLNPLGGTYAVLSSDAPNLQERAKGVTSVLDADPKWITVGGINNTGIVSYGGNNSAGLPLMTETLSEYPSLTAFLATNSVAMGYYGFDEWSDLVQMYPDTTFIAGDDDIWQLEYLKVNKIHGLVGQIPYEMGVLSVDALQEAVDRKDFPDKFEDSPEMAEFWPTNVLEHLVVPVELPELVVNNNELPTWALGVVFAFLVVVWITAIAFVSWAGWNRKRPVVALAQPEFLVMVAFGCVVLAATLVPLSLEGENGEGQSSTCMASMWTIFIGWTIIFSALFAKAWRINHVIRASQICRRVVITKWDVLKPFVLLLVANVVILICWTLIDPLVYVRLDAPGVDEWNRVIETYGHCKSQGSALPYIIPLAVLNVGLLILANYQAFQARNLEKEYHESQYIFIAMASLLQLVVIGAPILLLVRDEPVAWYLTIASMIFFISHGILLLIFIPKINIARNHADSRNSSMNLSSYVRSSFPKSSVALRKSSTGGGSISSNGQLGLPRPSDGGRSSVRSSIPDSDSKDDMDASSGDIFTIEEEEI